MPAQPRQPRPRRPSRAASSSRAPRARRPAPLDPQPLPESPVVVPSAADAAELARLRHAHAEALSFARALERRIGDLERTLAVPTAPAKEPD